MRYGTLERVRRSWVVSNFSPPIKYIVHNSNLVNVTRGVLHRVFYSKRDGVFQPPPIPEPGLYRSRLSVFTKLIRKHLPSTTPISREAFANLYRGRRLCVYLEAVRSLFLRAVERIDALLKVFVKAEKIKLAEKRDPDPRIISPRDPRYNVEVGRYLKPMEGLIYKAIAKTYGEITVFKGLNAAKSAELMRLKWLKYRDPVCVGLDASRFDQHVSKQALEWEHSIYLHATAQPAPLAQLLSWQLTNKAVGYVTDGKIKYVSCGGRMSGDMNTATGNCLIMCGLVHAYCSERGLDKRISLCNNGDDCVVFMERRHLATFSTGLEKWFLEMGFIMKVEKPVYEFEYVEFCQTKPVYDGESWTMVRNFPIALAKDCLSIKPLDSQTGFQKWARAVGEGGLALTGGLPVYQSFYLSLLRSSEGSKALSENDQLYDSGFFSLAKGMTRVKAVISPEARYSFWMSFGFTPEQQIAIESFYDNNEITYDGLHDHTPVTYLPDWFNLGCPL